MDYSLIKALHISAALSSFVFFLLRATWSLRGAPMMQRRWVRVMPHVLDTCLLALGVSLMVMLSAWPQQTPWLAAKLSALLLYIVLGSVAIKRGRSPAQKAAFTAMATLVFLYMLSVAVSHDPMGFFAL
jgi:uncharacterized membrane protein SirB2